MNQAIAAVKPDRAARAALKQRQAEFTAQQVGLWADRIITLLFNPVFALPAGYLLVRALEKRKVISGPEAALLGGVVTIGGLAQHMPTVNITQRGREI